MNQAQCEFIVVINIKHDLTWLETQEVWTSRTYVNTEMWEQALLGKTWHRVGILEGVVVPLSPNTGNNKQESKRILLGKVSWE